MGKTVTLKDGRDVRIRLMRPEDGEKLFTFLKNLPPEDRRYLRKDVTRWETVTQRVDEMQRGRVRIVVAVDNGEITAYGALELEGHGWGEGVAEIRLIIARPFQRQGLGMHMANELYLLANEHDVERLIVRMMRPQVRAHRIMQRLGFTEEFLIPEHVRDQDGEWQDLIIMRCNLDKLWTEMESLVEASDWRWHR